MHKAQSRGKRLVVQMNEKYLANSRPSAEKDMHEDRSKETTTMEQKSEARHRNRATAKNEHTLVRGSKSNKMITRTTINHESPQINVGQSFLLGRRTPP